MICGVEGCGEPVVGWAEAEDGLAAVCWDHASAARTVGMRVKYLRRVKHLAASREGGEDDST